MTSSWCWFIQPETAISRNRNGSRTLWVFKAHYRNRGAAVPNHRIFMQIQFSGHTGCPRACRKGDGRDDAFVERRCARLLIRFEIGSMACIDFHNSSGRHTLVKHRRSVDLLGRKRRPVDKDLAHGLAERLERSPRSGARPGPAHAQQLERLGAWLSTELAAGREGRRPQLEAVRAEWRRRYGKSDKASNTRAHMRVKGRTGAWASPLGA